MIINLKGFTTDNRMVVGGVYRFTATYGLPLDIVIAYLNSHKIVIDWPDFILEAIGEAHSRDSLKTKILSAINEVFGREYFSEFKKRLDLFI